MKKVLSTILVLCILFSSLNVVATAADDPFVPLESAYLSSYFATLSQGNSAGEIDISFRVFAARTGLTQIGVSEIRIYTG